MQNESLRVQGSSEWARPLADLLQRIMAAELSARAYLGPREIRMETAIERDGLWYADFAAPRNGHGPGKMALGTPIEGIELEDGQSFGEDTGLVYDPVSQYLAVQYNHSGPRLGGIEKYLYAADLSFGGLATGDDGTPDSELCGYKIGAVLKPDAYARLRRWGIYKSVEISISVPGAQAADMPAGRSLASILSAPLPEGVETVTIGLTARPGKDGGLGDAGVRGIISEIESLGVAVKSAFIRGKATEADRIGAVNLINDRVSEEVTVSLGHGLRYVRQDRWDALERALRGWLADGRLPQATQ